MFQKKSLWNYRGFLIVQQRTMLNSYRYSTDASLINIWSLLANIMRTISFIKYLRKLYLLGSVNANYLMT